MNDNINTFYSDLRKIQEGKFAIFLGAGASYDYGIPTMDEMASMLIKELQSSKKGGFFDEKAVEVICAISGISKEKKSGTESTEKDNQAKWNIEDLLTRLQHILDATHDKNSLFPGVTTVINEKNFSKEDFQSAESRLIEFMVSCYQLDVSKKTSHGDKSVEYLSNFLELVGEFHNSISIFTTNNDLCVEAAMMRLSQRQKSLRKKEFYLVDGFSHGILPVFSIANFSLIPSTTTNRVVVYLWKLHGSIDWIFCNPISPTESQAGHGDAHNNYNLNDDSIICRNLDSDTLKKFQDAGAISRGVAFDNLKTMIFPTPSKYSQAFNNPYMDLYQAFRRTLEMIELLLVAGTSFPDTHINSAIKAFLGRDNSMMYVVDPSLKKDGLCKVLGECDGAQPIIQMGFKTFVVALREAESSKEKTT